MSQGKIVDNKIRDNGIKKGVFWPSFIVVGGAAILGIVNNKLLVEIASKFFDWSLSSFGWLYQLVSVAALILIGILTFSKLGKLRFGGADAKPKYPFMTWFAMALTGGIATGVITWGVNEPLVYFSNLYGEMEKSGVAPGSPLAAIYAMARCFYNWTFIPYAMYALCGVVIAYMYFNRKKELSVSASLIPLFGEKVTKGIWLSIVDTLSLLAIALGLAASLGAGLALLCSGLDFSYGIKQGPMIIIILGLVITATYTLASVLGIDKGIKWLADFNAKIFYILLALLIVVGPTLYILRTTTSGLGYWLQNFWVWGLDPADIGGDALVKWWTLYDWAIWIAYAPLMGIFLAMISYGRTIREFMIINWIMPSAFGVIWFGVWGSTALHWQSTGALDLVATMKANGAVAGLWPFLAHLPLGVIIIPVVMITLIISFSTAADAMTTTISVMCTKNLRHDEEPKTWMKLLWGLSIGAIAFFMVAYAGGQQGVDGIKFLSAAGGAMVLFIFILQLASCIKMFFIDKIEE